MKFSYDIYSLFYNSEISYLNLRLDMRFGDKQYTNHINKFYN